MSERIKGKENPTLQDLTTVTFTYHADGSRATKETATEYIEYHYAGAEPN